MAGTNRGPGTPPKPVSAEGSNPPKRAPERFSRTKFAWSPKEGERGARSGGVDPERVFVLVANRADPSGQAPLDDLPGRGGRFDLVARFVNSALLTSHGIREGTAAIVLFTRGDPEPVAVRVQGGKVVGLRPDERSTAARLNKALSRTAMPVWQEVDDGIELRSVELGALLEDLPSPIWLLHEDGGLLEQASLAGGSFVVGDQDGFSKAQFKALSSACRRCLSVGPVSLQADQVASVVHNRLDRVQD